MADPFWTLLAMIVGGLVSFAVNWALGRNRAYQESKQRYRAEAEYKALSILPEVIACLVQEGQGKKQFLYLQQVRLRGDLAPIFPYLPRDVRAAYLEAEDRANAAWKHDLSDERVRVEVDGPSPADAMREAVKAVEALHRRLAD